MCDEREAKEVRDAAQYLMSSKNPNLFALEGINQHWHLSNTHCRQKSAKLNVSVASAEEAPAIAGKALLLIEDAGEIPLPTDERWRQDQLHR
jgi:hypothetical protein